MERGSDKHGPRQDEHLKADLRGMLGNAGGHREEWVDPEPPADDDPPSAPTVDPAAGVTGVDAEARMTRLRHDLDVANNSRFEDRDLPEDPEP